MSTAIIRAPGLDAVTITNVESYSVGTFITLYSERYFQGEVLAIAPTESIVELV